MMIKTFLTPPSSGHKPSRPLRVFLLLGYALLSLLVDSAILSGYVSSSMIGILVCPIIVVMLVYHNRFYAWMILFFGLSVCPVVFNENLRTDMAGPTFFFTMTALIILFEIFYRVSGNRQKMEKQLAQKFREMEIITETGQMLNSILEIEPLLENLLQAARNAIPAADKGSIMLVDPHDSTLEFRCLSGFQDERIKNICFSLDTSFGAQSMREKRPILIPDTRANEDIRYEGAISELYAIQSSIAAPLIVQDRAIGVITLDSSTRQSAFQEEDLSLLTAFSSSVAVAIERAQLFSKTQQQVKRLTSLRTIDRSINATKDLKTTLTVVVEQVIDQLKVDAARIYVYRPETKTLSFEIGQGYDLTEEQFAREDFFAEEAAQQKLIIHINNAGDEKKLNLAIIEAGFVEYYAVPLIAKDEVKGVLEILHRSPLNSDVDWLNYLETLAGQAAIAIDNANTFSSLKLTNERLASAFRELTGTKDMLVKAQGIGHVGSWRFDVLSHSIFWSDELYLIYGLSSNQIQLTYETYFDLIIPEDREPIRVMNELLFEDKNTIQAEYRIMRPDGDIRYLVSTCEAFRNDRNQVTEIIGTVRDRTDHKRAELEIQQAHKDLQQAYDSTLEGWARALDLRDHETEGHSQRVTELSLKLAAVMGISEAGSIHLRRGALLHDIGKIGIPDSILLKPGKLTAEEWKTMQKHPQYAYDLLFPIPYLRPSLDIPYCHHEKWDGSGYPRGLKGEEIPLAARIFSVADVLDALCSDRPYRKAWTTEKARQYILEQSGIHFDPSIVSVIQWNWIE